MVSSSINRSMVSTVHVNFHLPVCHTDLTLLDLRLQTGMRGAFGKPQGTVARVHIGQVIMSVRTKTQNKEHVVEALRRAKFKFPGRQKVNKRSLCKEDVVPLLHWVDWFLCV